MHLPDITAIMPAYNHELFVREAIDSVLSQDGVDLELLIFDDGSADSTRAVIEGVSDPRIRVFKSDANLGACAATNELIRQSRGEFIALINSDDAWLPGKLSYQLEILKSSPSIAATFGRARFFDRNGVPIRKEDLAFGDVFDKPNRSSAQWLRHFFVNANCLCHPTMMIRKACYEALGLYSNRFRQLPDFDMWVRLVKQYEIHVSDRELISFRMLPGENASSQTSLNAVRTINEHYLIAEKFFDGVTRQQLIEAFSDLLVVKDIPNQAYLDIEKALLFFVPNQWLWRPYQMIGLLRMRELLDSEIHSQLLKDTYNINDAWFQAQMGRINVLAPPSPASQSSWFRMKSFLKSIR